MRSFIFIFLLPLYFFTFSEVGASNSNAETVNFAIATAPPTPFQVKRLGKGADNPTGPKMVGRLTMPISDRPVPAVVMVLPCYEEKVYAPWLDLMNDWGYATLSFTRCGQQDKKFDGPIAAYDWKEGAEAAFGALKFLGKRPKIDADRIGIMSWSRFGMVPLSVLNEAGFAQFYGSKFKTAVALYPFCSFARGPHDGPILVLTAASDDWVSSEICQRLGRETASDRYPVEVVVFDSAYHGFDLQAFGPPKYRKQLINPDGFNANGGTLGYDKASHDRAVKLVQEHLASHL